MSTRNLTEEALKHGTGTRHAMGGVYIYYLVVISYVLTDGNSLKQDNIFFSDK